MRNEEKRFLIVRPDRIGDVILSTPIPEAIKSKYPKSFVGVLVRQYTKDIFLHNPFVDIIILKDDETNIYRKILELRSHKFSHALTLLPTERLNYILFAAGIKTRIGVGHKFYQTITNTKSVYRRKYEEGRHEADYCFDTVRKLGIDKRKLKSKIFLSSDEKEEVKTIRKELLGSADYLIGIHATSGNSAPNWKPENYSYLASLLRVKNNIKVVITDNEVPDILSKTDNFIFPNTGKTLRQSILNFAALDLLISASTGPMHIASALDVKTLSLFCPLPACSPELWGPLGNESKIVLPTENYCQTVCPGDPKKCSFEGEGGIDPELVVKRVENFMGL